MRGHPLGIARNQLIMLDGALLPSALINLPGGSEKLDGFVQGFVDALVARMGMETRSASTYARTSRSTCGRRRERS